MASSDLASPDELDRQLRSGALEMMRDAVGQMVERDKLPVGVVPPGQTLVQFWNLDFPMQGPDYSRPAVTTLLLDMLAVRRLSPPAANALGLRIYSSLPAAFGREGSVMAAMLLARCRQALAEPESWPALLDDAELSEAYKIYHRDQGAFTLGAAAVGAAAVAPKVGAVPIGRNTNLPEWLRGLGRGLGKLQADIMRQMPADFRSISIPDAGFNQGKPFLVSSLRLLHIYIGWILSSGALQNKRQADRFAAELTRRGLVIP